MSEKNVNNAETRVNPIRITDNKADVTYELDFTRDSVRFAEARGFDIDSIGKFPATKIPELFYYAFRKNHRNLAKSQTDNILETKLKGLSGPMLERLIALYNQAALTHMIATEEDMEKNELVTVEL